MNILPTGKTKRFFIFSIIFLVLALAVFGAFLLLIKDKNAEVREVEAALSEEMKRSEELEGLRTLLSETSDEQALLDSYLVRRGEEAVFLSYLERLADEAGVGIEISSVTTRDITADNAHFEFLRVEVTVEGSWDGVFQFTKTLSYLPLTHTLPSVRLESMVEEGGASVWRSTSTLEVLKEK